VAGNLVETLIGAVVLVVAAVFMVFAYSRTDVGEVSGYELSARFERIDGLSPGADVRMSGIKVGTVIEQELDERTYVAVVRLSIDPKVRLPEDSSAEVVSEGLLGGKYLSLSPGGSDAMIAAGGEIKYTQSSVNFEQLLGKFMFSQSSSDEAAQ
jgi:phospholipid/cholesterol/gamma-HCH transport system substrate-binding protein